MKFKEDFVKILNADIAFHCPSLKTFMAIVSEFEGRGWAGQLQMKP